MPGPTPSFEPVAADRYLREDVVGEGGMGRVWRATDRRLDRAVAFKEPKGGPDSPAAARLRREIDLLARLSHPAIVPLLDAGTLKDGRPFLVMRLLSGVDLDHAPPATTLAERLHRVRQLRDVVAGVAHAHEQGVVHRDLKPANVRFEPDGAVQILDWGLARVLPSGTPTPGPPLVPLTRAGTRVGTPAYMSPEQAAGQDALPSADVWSLGILMWEALCGRRAYAGRAASEVLAGVLSGPPPSVSATVPEVPPALAKVVDQALAPGPQRPVDAAALLVLLDAALATPARPPSKRWPTLAVIGVSLVTFGVLAWAWPTVPPPDTASTERTIQLALRAGESVEAEQLAADLLLTDPDNPVARGALVRTVPRPRLLWSHPIPTCTIGEVIRWDGRALACASERLTRFYTIDSDGLEERWRRPEEYHQLAFVGPHQVLGVPPRSDTVVRMAIDDGTATVPFTAQLTSGIPAESRTPSVAVSVSGTEVHRETLAPGADHFTATTRARTFRSNRTIVLQTGAEVYVDGQDVVRTTPDGTSPAQRWTIPAEEGQPLWFTVSANEAYLAVCTSLDKAAVTPTDTTSWSPWADLGLSSTRHISVSDDGKHAALASLGDGVVWAVDSPADHIRLPGTIRTTTFVDSATLLVLGAEFARLWRFDQPLAGGSLHLPSPVQALAWNAGGLMALHTSGARVWRPDGTVLADVPDAIRVTAEASGSRRAVVLADHTLRVFDGHGARPDLATPGCSFVAWGLGGPIVCASTEGGPVLVDPDTRSLDTRPALPRHRWYWAGATGPHVALMDWDTSVYRIVDGVLTTDFTVPWTTRTLPGPDGESVLLNGRDGIYRRSYATGEQTRVSRTRGRAVDFALSPDHRILAVAMLTGGASLWDVDSGDLLLQLPATVGQVRGIAWSPDGTRLAVGDDAGIVRILDLSAFTAPTPLLRAGVDAAWPRPEHTP